MRRSNFPPVRLVTYGLFLVALMSVQLQAQARQPRHQHSLCRETSLDTSGDQGASGVYTYKSAAVVEGDKNHEPPIGFGGGSAFFDMPAGLGLKKGERDDEKYRLYDVITDQTDNLNKLDDHKPYTDIECVLIMTEDNGSGNVSLTRYNLPENSRAELWVWLAEDSDVTFPAGQLPDIKIRGMDKGVIRTKKGFNHKTLRKTYRKNRYVRSSKLRVVRWEIHYTDSGVSKIYSDENDDLYYFYIAFRHPL